jgi:hypothetical protein
MHWESPEQFEQWSRGAFVRQLRHTLGDDEARQVLDEMAAEEQARAAEEAAKDATRRPAYMTCIHRPDGLCVRCQQEYATDPDAWIEFGDHTEGLRRWNAELEEIAKDAAGARPGPVNPDIPF